MKKFVSVLLCVCMMTAVSAFTALAAVNGDVDGTNRVEAADARLILRNAVGLQNFTQEQKNYADLDFDGSITAADARIALRITVGLEIIDKNAYAANEYEALRGKNYRASFTRTAPGESDTSVTIAVTEGASYFKTEGFSVADITGTGSENQKLTLSIYTIGKDMYFSDEKSKSYANLAGLESLFGEGNASMFNTEEFAEEMLLFAEFPALNTANSTQDATFKDVSCKAYLFDIDGGTTKVYMSGKKLLGIETYNGKNTLTGTFLFDYVSTYVAASEVSLPTNYADKSEFILEFLLEAFGDLILK